MRRRFAVVSVFVALGAVACDSATAPVDPDAGAVSPVASMASSNALEALEARNLELGIQQAQMGEGFCFVAAADSQGGFGGFTGGSKIVFTPSGNENYVCKGDLLFGELNQVVNAKGVTLFNDFGLGPQEDCHIVATPGPKGQLSVTCTR
jgi:hypothetical protein